MHGGGPPIDAMMDSFFPPEIVMQNQKAIGLTEQQRATIIAEMKNAMARFTELQWQQNAEEEAMKSIVTQERPDEKQVLAQLDKLMAIENDIKRMRTGMLLRVRNVLTAEQQAKLQQIKGQRGQEPERGKRQGFRGRPMSALDGPEGLITAGLASQGAGYWQP